MSLGREDLHQLLGFLENKLLIEDDIISKLKHSKSTEYLNTAKYNQLSFYETKNTNKTTTMKESEIGCYQHDPLVQLDGLIATQHQAQLKLKEQIEMSIGKYVNIARETEKEKSNQIQQSECAAKVAIALVNEMERLKEEVRRAKDLSRKLEHDLIQASDTKRPTKRRNVLERLIGCRRAVEKDFQAECHKCFKMEEDVQLARKEVCDLERQLETKKEENVTAMKLISGPFKEQMSSVKKECDGLRLKISEVESSSEELRDKLHKMKESMSKKNASLLSKKSNDNEVHDMLSVNGVLNSSFSSPENTSSSSLGTLDDYQSFLDSFESTIQMIDKEIQNSNVSLSLRRAKNMHSIESSNKKSDASELFRFSENPTPFSTPTGKNQTSPSYVKFYSKSSNDVQNGKIRTTPESFIESKRFLADGSDVLTDVSPASESFNNTIAQLKTIASSAETTTSDSGSSSFNSKIILPASLPHQSSSAAVKKHSPVVVGRSKGKPPPPPPSKTSQIKPSPPTKQLVMPSKSS